VMSPLHSRLLIAWLFLSIFSLETAPAKTSLGAGRGDQVHFEVGGWAPDLAAGAAGRSRGNHRVVVEVEDPTVPAVVARISWRRCDPTPERKDVIVVDAATGEEVPERIVLRIDEEEGLFVFRPNAASRTYHFYYFPYETTGLQYPTLNYLPPRSAASPEWLKSLGTLDERSISALPEARTVSIQSIDAFHSFAPMEVIATEAEVTELLRGEQQAFYLFPEDREYSIRMRRFLPRRWAERGLTDRFEGTARRGEYYTFQIGVLAGGERLEDLSVELREFTASDGRTFGGDSFTCFNKGGIDHFGRPFEKMVSVEAGEVQPLWFGVSVPAEAVVARYKGSVTVSARGTPSRQVTVHLDVSSELLTDHGEGEPEKMSRLRWLDSTVGSDPDVLIDPYTPVEVEGRKLSILGRDVILDDTGLPAEIRSWFTPEMTALADEPEAILARPIIFCPEMAGGLESWTSEPFEVGKSSSGRAWWSVRSSSAHFDLNLDGALEYDGLLEYRLSLTAREVVEVDDISLLVELLPDAARYMLGLGRRGGKRPEQLDWKWKVENHQEGLWLGNVHKGLQYVLRDENYERPLNTNFYQQKPLNLPPSWHNDGAGGIRLACNADAVTLRNYSGPRTLEPGETLHFNVRFLITPFRPLDTVEHFKTRFVHRYVPVDKVREWGGTVVNIHHANAINPYINYPFHNLDEQRAYIDEAHAKGVKVKLYYTIRELTYKAHELFALRSLGDEVLNDGEGGGHSWLQEHLRGGYHSAWHAWSVDDASILNKGTSRWTNYYVEGLSWLAENQRIDGLYLDDLSFSRETVKRMVAVLQRHRNEVVIDLHSANQFNPRDGFINSALLYLEHLPYITRLWFGEYFEYDRDADYWLTEVSGLPFGLMGEMLQDGGHPYRGLLYGMTARIYGEVDPRPVWRMIDEFGIEESRLLGYWLDSTPVRTDRPGVVATTYLRPGAALIVLASWELDDVMVNLEIDWERLGVTASEGLSFVAPAVDGLQERATHPVEGPIPVPAAQGVFLRLELP
jgi:hypothetical protein